MVKKLGHGSYSQHFLLRQLTITPTFYSPPVLHLMLKIGLQDLHTSLQSAWKTSRGP